MTPSAGSRLGMGEVFRARDTKLNRVVALKVLPDSFAGDPDRLVRFTREAQTLASLNHPNIAAIYGLETQEGLEGTRCIVMELVEGEDLSQRIARGPVPLDDAIPIAKQIADALEAAHEQAPEQARGKPVDRRADIWAFGAVLFEMLTGARLFHDDTMSDTVAAVLTRELDWNTLPAREARAWNMWSRRADGGGDEQRLLKSDEIQFPLALTRDGASVIFSEGSGQTGSLQRTPADGAGPATPLFKNSWGSGAGFSPDGRWLAFESFESGRMDVFVRPYRDGDRRIQVSTTGGERPVWRNGELFYLGGGGISVVSVAEHGGSLTISKPSLLFAAGGDTRLIPTFDVTADGQHFLMLRTRGGQHVSLIFDWPAEVNHR